MIKRFALAVVFALAFGSGATAFAQTKSKIAMLPVVNADSGRVEAFLQLEPSVSNLSKGKWRIGVNTLEDAFGIEDDAKLALVCSSRSSLARSMNGLGKDCLIGSLASSAPKQDFAAIFSHGGTRLGLGARSGGNTAAWLSPIAGSNRIKQTDLAFFAQSNVGRTGMVSIAGTMARARLMPAAELPVLADQWNTSSLRLSGGYRGVRADVVGRVVTVPGQPKFEGLDLGVSWRTPWSGQLSVGAENVLSKGQNPFAPKKADNKPDNAVPYVRYKQDL